MYPATPIPYIGRTLALFAFSGLGTASLPGPIYPKTPFYTDGHIVFCYHSKYPKYEVLSYRIFIGVKRGGLLSVIFMEGRATAVTCTLFLCLYY
jgi:hypothetical protein